MICEYCFRFW